MSPNSGLLIWLTFWRIVRLSCPRHSKLDTSGPSAVDCMAFNDALRALRSENVYDERSGSGDRYRYSLQLRPSPGKLIGIMSSAPLSRVDLVAVVRPRLGGKEEPTTSSNQRNICNRVVVIAAQANL